MATSQIAAVLDKNRNELLNEWLEEQLSAATLRPDLMTEAELRRQSANLLGLVAAAVAKAGAESTSGPEWAEVTNLLREISASRAAQGFSATETATFVLSLKAPLFARVRKALGKDAESLAEDVVRISTVLDKLALVTTDAFMNAREQTILRQQQELLELSTPVVKLWEGVLALPLIGVLDSARTQVVMESLLQAIVDTGAEIAIIDITGVPTVDTLVAQHLLRTVAAARLMGADCIISGIRPQIAQTIVHLGVDLTNVTTKASLADAFVVALQRTGGSILARGQSPD
jgi:rsbT co-antagonist protein RsbR